MPPDYKRASVVDQMIRYLPFNAQAGNLFEEHVSAADAPEPYETKTFEFVLQLLTDPEVSLIILTGDAGHGKTHLCRRILERSGLPPEEAVALMKTAKAGEEPIQLPDSDRGIRVVKDLSEFPEDRGAEILISILADRAVGIVSANEGRLRSVVGRRSEDLGVILKTLEEGIRHGHTTIDGQVHIINLNFQSVTPDGGGFLEHLLDNWTRDNRRWVSCSGCAAADTCPIFENKEYLGEKGADGDRRRDGFVQLVRTAEQTGYVLTIRETLILAAYLITGGATCDAVHQMHRRNASAQMRDLKLVQLLFDRALSDREATQLGVLQRIRRYDPGVLPHRDVDEQAIRDLEDEDRLGQHAWFGSAAGQTRRQKREEARGLRQEVRTKRRESYFEAPRPGRAGMLDRARRTGLYHYPEFDHVQGEDEDPKGMRGLIERVVHGLHVIQGIRPSDRSHLHLVDPAFSRSSSHTSVIALRIPKRDLWLWGLHEFWRHRDAEHEVRLVDAVDWLDRSVCLCEGKESPKELISLDLLQFEFVLRAADGVAFSRFHAADRRRILSLLAEIAEASESGDDEIRFVMADTVKRIVLERDGTIEVHGGA